MKQSIAAIPEIFSLDYLKEHGILFSPDTFCVLPSGENPFDADPSLYDKSPQQGGKPVTGLLYELFPDGTLRGYSHYVNGREHGICTIFHENGQIALYKDARDNTYVGTAYTWYPNGQLKKMVERNRPDNLAYCRSRAYDEDGKLLALSIVFEMSVYLEKGRSNKQFQVTRDKNGEIRSIVRKEVDSEDLFIAAELDEHGIPTKLVVNPQYSTVHLYTMFGRALYPTPDFDETFTFQDDLLMHTDENNETTPYTGTVCERFQTGSIHKLQEFRDGKPFMHQLTLYADGNPASDYYVNEKGKYYNHFVKWYKKGCVQEVRIYDKNANQLLQIKLDESGAVVSEKYMFDQVFSAQ